MVNALRIELLDARSARLTAEADLHVRADARAKEKAAAAAAAAAAATGFATLKSTLEEVEAGERIQAAAVTEGNGR